MLKINKLKKKGRERGGNIKNNKKKTINYLIKLAMKIL